MPRRHYNELDMVLTIGQTTLTILKDAAQYVPSPGIGIAAATALSILNLVLTAQDNRETFVMIAKDACNVMETVVKRVNISATDGTLDITNLDSDARQLNEKMEAIYTIVKKHVKRGVFKRIVFSNLDAGVVKDCQRLLDSALQLFGLQSDIEIRKGISILNQRVEQILGAVSQPQMPTPNTQSPNPPPSWPQPSTPSYQSSPAPQQAPSHPISQASQQAQSYPASPPPPPQHIPSYPSSPPPQQAYSPPVPQTREDRRAARHARADARHARGVQQSHQTIDAGFLGVPVDSTFSNVQNHISPEGGIAYSYVNGDVVNNSRDDSFNVSGTGNSVNISFVR